MTWQSGQSGNAKGRPPALPAELKAIKKLSPQYVRAVISKLARMKHNELLEWLQVPVGTPGAPNNLEMMVASVMTKAISEGDHNKFNFLLDRSIGKVVEERKVQLDAVTYQTTVSGDGTLMQEVLREVVGDDDSESV